MAQFPAREGYLFVLKSVWAHSGAYHCHSSHLEVKNKWNVMSVLSYVFMLCTETTLLPTTVTFCEVLESVTSVDIWFMLNDIVSHP